MHECRYCDATFKDDEPPAGHFASAYDWVELGWSDHRRIKTLVPEEIPQNKSGSQLGTPTEPDELLDQDSTKLKELE